MSVQTFLKVSTIINLLVATGFAVAGVVNPGLILPIGATTEKSMAILALYAAARTIPLAVIATISIIIRYSNALLVIAVLAGTIQLLDGFIGIYQHDLSKSVGPFIIAIVEFSAIYLAKNKISNQLHKNSYE